MENEQMTKSKLGFDNDLYIKLQTEEILRRIEKCDGKLYLEFGGKIFDDMHASRVLPGFQPNVKTRILQTLKDKAEIIFCISAADIERNKIRADFGITYGSDVLRLIDSLRALDIYVSNVVITQFTGQPTAKIFKNKLEMRGEKVHFHYLTKGYPNDVDKIVSDEGYGANCYIETTRPLVVVSAPGPGSGKLATCLCQLYHEFKMHKKAGYAKFETFPVWNFPLNHPVNAAYEAATADIRDFNMIDNFHLEAYGKMTVNYNRDCEIFPVLKNILQKITGEVTYKSPTDMGVNMVGMAVTDDAIVCEAAKQEIIRRYYKTLCDYKQGICDQTSVHRLEVLMQSQNCSPLDRKVVLPALEKSKKCKSSAVAIELPNGKIITGRTTNFMTACAGALLNAVKEMCGIDDEIKLISPSVIEPIHKLKKEILHNRNTILGLEEVLIALSMSAVINPLVEQVLPRLAELRGCEMHSTVILFGTDEKMLRKLGINLTCEAEFISSDLFN